jgi:hypothetical protein
VLMTSWLQHTTPHQMVNTVNPLCHKTVKNPEKKIRLIRGGSYNRGKVGHSRHIILI